MAQQFGFRQYGQQDGLSSKVVHCMFQDKEGYLWMCTEAGLTRYDGTTFAPYREAKGIDEIMITSVQQAPDGHIWALSSRTIYVGGSDGFAPLQFSGAKDLHRVRRLAFIDTDHVLVLAAERLLMLSRTSSAAAWTISPAYGEPERAHLTALDSIRSLFTDRSNTVWFGCGKGICQRDGETTRYWGARDGVPEEDWAGFMHDKQGRLWARGGRHVATLSPGQDHFEPHDAPDPGAAWWNLDFSEDEAGRALILTAQGIARWDGSHWEEFTSENGLPEAELNALLVDRHGDVWLGSRGAGLWRWRGYGAIESWTRRQGLRRDDVWTILRDHSNRLWLGTAGGCQRFEALEHRFRDCAPGLLPQSDLHGLAEGAHGDLWLSFLRGELWHLAMRQDQSGKEAWFGERVAEAKAMSRVFIDPAGHGVVSGREPDLMQFNAFRPELKPTPVVLPLRSVSALAFTLDAEGRAWSSAVGGGLLRFGDRGWEPLPDGPDPVKDRTFDALAFARDGLLWAGDIRGGLWRIHGPDYRRAEELSDPAVAAPRSVYSLGIDSRDWVWAGTDLGVAMYDGKVWRHIDESSGVVSNDTNENALLIDLDGSVWVGTSGGLVHVIRPEAFQDTTPLDIRWSSARYGARSLLGSGTVQVPWDRRAPLELGFTSLSFDRSPGTRYRYRIRGLSDEWFESAHADVSIPALEPNRYQLEVFATDPNQMRRSATLTLEFEVLPPWWQTLWFRALVLVLAAALLALAWREQVRRLKVRETLVERAMRDSLTRLWNRAAILEILTREISHAQRRGSPLAIALIDIDHFKEVNDSHGHLGGDEVLREVARRLEVSIRKEDWIGRYGGEELLVVLPEAIEFRPLSAAERMRCALSDTRFDFAGRSFSVTASLGVAWLTADMHRPEELIAAADAALYRAKANGRNQVAYADTTQGALQLPNPSEIALCDSE